MRAFRLAVAAAILLGLAGCGSAESVVMPDVVGVQLDSALAQVEDAGFSDDVDVVGGGLFGVVDDSNWQVCEQSPAPGEPVAGTPQLTVDRTCGDDAAAPTDGPTSDDVTGASSEPSAEPSAEPTTAGPEILTVDTSADLAAVLTETDYCSAAVANFAATYEGSVIEFDASVGAINHHDEYDTRYDILISAGDFSESSSTGPQFQFRDVNLTNDLHFTGSSVPDTIGVGLNLRVTAEVGEFESSSCLLLLEPVATAVR